MRLAAAIAAAALTACSQARAPDQAQSAETPGEAQLTIGPDGAGGVAAALEMSATAVSAAAPGFRVTTREGALAGVTHAILTLDLDGETIFTVTPSPDGARVHAVVTRSTRVRGPDDEIVGRFRFEEARAEDVALCVAEYGAETPSFACAASAEAPFWRVFALPASYRGPGDPFEAIDPTARRRAQLIEMRWFAPRDGAL